jgi:hypothetical protein
MSEAQLMNWAKNALVSGEKPMKPLAFDIKRTYP